MWENMKFCLLLLMGCCHHYDIKVKVSLSMPRLHMGRKVIVLHSSLNTGMRWEVSGTITSQSLHPLGKELWYPPNRRLSGPQKCSEEKNSYPYHKHAAINDISFYKVIILSHSYCLPLPTDSFLTLMQPTQPATNTLWSGNESGKW